MNTSTEWQIDNLPNRLTLFRIALIPIIIGCLGLNLIDHPWILKYQLRLDRIAAIAFIIAAITDFIDGYVARKRNMITVFGTFLDPIADKFLVVSSLIVLQGLNRIHVLLVIILVLRELYMTSLRLLATERGISVPVSSLGKWKTALQMIAIPLLMCNEVFYKIPLLKVGTVLIYIAALLSVYSALHYSYGMIIKIKLQKRQKTEEKKQIKKSKPKKHLLAFLKRPKKQALTYPY